MKQEMMGWQWHQLDHMQIICTLLQTENNASTSSVIFTAKMLFLMLNYVKALKAIRFNHAHNCFMVLFRDYLGQPVPEKIFFWTLWCKGR